MSQNVEAHVIARLGTLLGVPVFADVPAARPDAFVTVERTGGGRLHRGLLDRPTLAVQSWAPTRHAASELSGQVDAAMHAIEGWPVTSVVTDTIYNFPAEGPHARYQGVYQLTSHI